MILVVTLAVGVRFIPRLRSYQFTVWIIAAVICPMLLPALFLRLGPIDLQNRWLFLFVVQAVMNLANETEVNLLIPKRKQVYESTRIRFELFNPGPKKVNIFEPLCDGCFSTDTESMTFAVDAHKKRFRICRGKRKAVLALAATQFENPFHAIIPFFTPWKHTRY